MDGKSSFSTSEQLDVDERNLLLTKKLTNNNDLKKATLMNEMLDVKMRKARCGITADL